MHVLGLCALDGPAAACLVRDGRVVASAAEAPFSRRPADPGFPNEAAWACLRAGRLGAAALDAVAVAGSAARSLEAVGAGVAYRESGGGGISSLARRLTGLWRRGPTLADRIAEELDPALAVREVEREAAAAAAVLGPVAPAGAIVLVSSHGAEGWRIVRPEPDGWRADDSGATPLAEALHRARDAGADLLALAGPAAGAAAIAAARETRSFRRVVAHPAAGAGAAAIGAARLVDAALRRGSSSVADADVDVAAADTGIPGYTAAQIRTFLRTVDRTLEELDRDDVAPRLAALLAEGRTVARFDGGLEHATFPLATRAILRRADADPAPSPDAVRLVPADRVAALFEEADDLPAVPVALRPRPDARTLVGAPDGSPVPVRAIPLTPPRGLAAVLAQALDAGIPALAATPLALAGTPPAATPADAWATFAPGGSDALLLGTFLAVR